MKFEDVNTFWLDELDPSDWYKSEPDLDDDIRRRFLSTWQEAREGAHGLWLMSPSGVLAYLILTDQFPRNMFRGSADSFATDPSARAVATDAIKKEWDMEIPEPQRQFFYVPLMHSEDLVDQDRCIDLMKSRMPEEGADSLLHARAHRHIIQVFGRFPYRNAALGRESTKAEVEWMENEGYASALRAVE